MGWLGVNSASIDIPQVLLARRDESTTKLDSIRGSVDALRLSDRYPSVAVYVTGSIGRCEGGSHSDLDIFCVDVEADTGKRIGKLDSIRLFGDLIKVNETGEFPPFSGDGRYLVVHHIEDVLRFLGTRDDDYRNLFTARMLLLLESRVLVGQAAYDECVRQVIDLYWRDETIDAGFRPTFLINDLVRYWKTLCLSHEAERGQGDAYKRERRVAVLKLQFNRLWMVFNGLAYLLHGFDDAGVSRAHIERLVRLSPLERVLEIGEHLPTIKPCIEHLLGEYSWFLEAADRSKLDTEEFFAVDDNYREGRRRGELFGSHMAQLVDDVANETPLKRYLLI